MLPSLCRRRLICIRERATHGSKLCMHASQQRFLVRHGRNPMKYTRYHDVYGSDYSCLLVVGVLVCTKERKRYDTSCSGVPSEMSCSTKGGGGCDPTALTAAVLVLVAASFAFGGAAMTSWMASITSLGVNSRKLSSVPGVGALPRDSRVQWIRHVAIV